ncbi:MAG: hypothetical protein QOI07_1155 [Verrucomicrobiota bacterium]|jgi:hypothetical protein
MKNRLDLVIACTAALVCCVPFAANAATKKSASPTPSPSPSPMASASPKTKASPTPKTTSSPAANTTTDVAKARAIPFHGMISAADQKAKTFTIAGKEHSRVFKVTDKTVITKAGAPATMKDVVANEEVRGSYWKVTDGTLEAKTVKLGPKTDAEKAADEKRKMKKKEKESATEPSASPSASPKP